MCLLLKLLSLWYKYIIIDKWCWSTFIKIKGFECNSFGPQCNSTHCWKLVLLTVVKCHYLPSLLLMFFMSKKCSLLLSIAINSRTKFQSIHLILGLNLCFTMEWDKHYWVNPCLYWISAFVYLWLPNYLYTVNQIQSKDCVKLGSVSKCFRDWLCR